MKRTVIARPHEIHLGGVGIDVETVVEQVEGRSVVARVLLVDRLEEEIAEATAVSIAQRVGGHGCLHGLGLFLRPRSHRLPFKAAGQCDGDEDEGM